MIVFKTRFYIVATIIILVTATGHFVPTLFSVGKGMLWFFLLVLLIDIVLLWHRRGLYASRLCGDRFSNGDDNDVRIRLESSYPFLATELAMFGKCTINHYSPGSRRWP